MILTSKDGKAQKKHIYADGEYVFTTDAQYWYSLNLPNGTEMEEGAFAALQAKIRCRGAFMKTADMLSRRPYSEKEIRTKLRAAGYTEEEREAAIEKAYALALIDDADYASRLAPELYRRKGFSPKRIETDLIYRGIDREAAKTAVEALEADPVERIVNLLETKFASRTKSAEDMKRTAAALQRLGYSFDEIRSAFARRLDGSSEP